MCVKMCKSIMYLVVADGQLFNYGNSLFLLLMNDYSICQKIKQKIARTYRKRQSSKCSFIIYLFRVFLFGRISQLLSSGMRSVV